MAFREPEVRERLDLRVHRGDGLLGHPPLAHPREHPGPDRLDPFLPALRPERAAQQVRLLRSQVRERHRHRDDLLLEHGDAQRTPQDRFQTRVQEPNLRRVVATFHERVHSAALDGPRTDHRHLDRQVVEAARLQPRQQPQLGARLHLEHPDRVGAAEHLVDGGLLFRDRVEVEPTPEHGRDLVEAVLDGRQDAQAQQVELDQPHPLAIVFVPLQHGAPRHRRVLDGHHLADRAIREHHTARVDAQVPRFALQLLGEPDHSSGDARLGLGRGRRRTCGLVGAGCRTTTTGCFRPTTGAGAQEAALHRLRPRILLTLAEPEGFRHIPHRIARGEADHVRHLCCVAAAVRRIDILDDLLTPVRIEVDVDIRFLISDLRQKSFEREPVVDRIHRRDVEQVAHRTGRRRAAPLAEDAPPARELHDVVHDQEVPGKVFLLDHLQFVQDARPMLRGEPRVFARGPLPDQFAQTLHRGDSSGQVEGGQLRAHRAQIEGTLGGHRERVLHRAREVPEPSTHFCSRMQVRRGGRGQPALRLVEAAPCAHRRHRLRQGELLRGRIVCVARRHQGSLGAGCRLGERAVSVVVERVTVVEQLHVDSVATEGVLQPLDARGGRIHIEHAPAGFQGATHQRLAAPGEHHHIPGKLLYVRFGIQGTTLLTARELGLGERRRQAVVSACAPSQHKQVFPLRVGHPVLPR